MLQGEAKALHTAKRSSGVSVSEDIVAAWMKVRGEDALEQLNTWLVATYAEGSKTDIVLKTTGHGVLALVEALGGEEDISFGGLRVKIDGQERFVRFAYIGENVGGMKKGKAALHKQGVWNALEGAVADVSLEAPVGEASIATAIQDAARASEVAFL